MQNSLGPAAAALFGIVLLAPGASTQLTTKEPPPWKSQQRAPQPDQPSAAPAELCRTVPSRCTRNLRQFYKD